MTIHGRSETRTYHSWANMKARCNGANPDNKRYYHDLGIMYQASWEDFEVFHVDMGECPEGFWLDRINNNKDYTKENCQWISKRDSNRNRGYVKLTAEKVRIINGLRRSIRPRTSIYYAHSLIGRLFGVSSSTIYDIARGRSWSDVQ